MEKEVVTKTDCPSCELTHYGHKNVCHEHLTAWESVSMAVVGILAVATGTILGIA